MGELMCGIGYEINWNAWAAIGTVLAVIAALFIHLRDERRHNAAQSLAELKEREARGVRATNIAIQIFPFLISLDQELKALPQRVKFFSGKALEDHLVDGLMLSHLDLLDASLKDIDALPAVTAKAVLSLLSYSRITNSLLQRKAARYTPGTRVISPLFWDTEMDDTHADLIQISARAKALIEAMQPAESQARETNK